MFHPIPHSLNCRGILLSLDRPRIMGILNLTPDSFSDGGKYNSLDAALAQTERMLQEGADIIDIGGYSSRPYAPAVSAEEECRRIEQITAKIIDRFPEAIVSIDTYRPSVAKVMLEIGAHMINDITAGAAMGEPEEQGMRELVSEFQNVPYIGMHKQGTPANMQDNPQYEDVTEEVWQFFVEQIQQVREIGIKDFVMDPGFGFGKSMLHNYQLLGNLSRFAQLDVPILVGLSRKSMLYKLLETKPEQVLEAASALHLRCLEAGAHILRTHDVQAAAHIVRLFTYLRENGIV